MNRNIRLSLIDAIMSASALYLAFLLRFELLIPKNFLIIFFNWLPWFVSTQILIFNLSGLYARIWRYTSLFDLYAILSSVAISSGLSFILVFFTMGSRGYPRSVLILYFIFNSVLTTVVRLGVRVYYSHYDKNSYIKSSKKRKNLLLIGAGKSADIIAREILTSARKQYSIAGFIDDDPQKHGALLHGKKIYCSINELPNLQISFDELLITSPSLTGDEMRRIVSACKSTGKRYKTVPALSELIDKEISLAGVRDVSYADLLGREEIILDMNSIENMLYGKRVLISGAGGSIGFELVKQCLAFDPSEIICLDINEEKIFNIEQKFNQSNHKTIIKTILASVHSEKECEKVFIENRPHIVFHAAAYKHVPIQELHPWTAVKTNLGGTFNLVKLSDKYEADKFVLVSTDKAVNPVNVMGATKRAAELLIQSFNPETNTTLMAVRFGNVLGSSGSAIPTFQKQINQGGPITITHPEMTRYFMSLQEASQLIIQCGSLGKDGEIFLLEMGKPIKILQMAKDLIRLSGLEPEVDIPLVFTGLRPGEKLYEELQLLNEKKVMTEHKKIMVLKESDNPKPWTIMKQSVSELISASEDLDSDKIQILLKKILPTYTPRMFNTIIDKKSISYHIKGEA